MNYVNSIYFVIYIFICYLLDKVFQITKKNWLDIFVTYIYFVILYICLFNRKTLDERIFSSGEYIKDWLPKVFTNKIIFINIIGNIILFIPLGVIVSKLRYKLLISMIIILVIILSIETVQYLTKKGVFDVVDVVLNVIGASIGYIFKD